MSAARSPSADEPKSTTTEGSAKSAIAPAASPAQAKAHGDAPRGQQHGAAPSPVSKQVVETLRAAPPPGRVGLTSQIAALRAGPRLNAEEQALRSMTDPLPGDTDVAYRTAMQTPVPAELVVAAERLLKGQKALLEKHPRFANLGATGFLPLLRLIDPRFGRLPKTIHDTHSHATHGKNGGFGTYEMKFGGNMPDDVRGDSAKESRWLVDRLRAQATSGKTVVFAVEPHLPSPKPGETWTTVSPDGKNVPGYYLSRDEHGRTIMGQALVEDGVIRNDQIAFDRYGNQVTAPFSMTVEEFEQKMGVKVPPGTEALDFVTSLVDCDLHYPDVVIDRWHAENHAALMREERSLYGSNIIGDAYIIGLTAGDPMAPDSDRNVFDSLRALNRVEAEYQVGEGALKAIWGETNLSKEVVHEMGGQVPLSRMSEVQLDHLDGWTRAIGQTGMPVIIHCDSGTPAQGLNKVTSNLATFLLPSNLENVEPFIAYANRNPDTDVIWAHAGLGFTVQMPPGYLTTLQEVLDRCPNVTIDISWDAIHGYMKQDLQGWATFLGNNRDRLYFGSDTIATTQNPAENSRIDVARNLARIGLIEQLDLIDPTLKELLFSGNFSRGIETGVERAIAFRTDEKNSAWLQREGHKRGEAPPRIWQRDEAGAFQLVENPAHRQRDPA
ncbi:MAG: hypothetical protein ACO3JL_11245 [Myxococcota bacterium]